MNQELKTYLADTAEKITALLSIVDYAYAEESDHLASLPDELRLGSEGTVLEQNITALENAFCCLEEARDHIEQAYAGE